MSAPRTRIGLREIRAMSPNETIFDGGTGSVPGFGARRRAGPHVSYFIMYRTRDGRQRRYTIGTHGAPWTPDAARAKAQQVLVAARIEGADPQADKKAKRSAATIAELCDMYMEDAEAGRLLTRRGIAKKPSTLVTDRSFIQAHIKPLLGRMKVPAVTREDVEHFMHQVAEGATRRRVKTSKKGGLSHVRGGKGVASRTVGLLGGIFTYATLQFSTAADVEPVWQRVVDGTLRNVSAGYRVHRYEQRRESASGETIFRAVDWEPYEISMVPVPIDHEAMVR